MQTTVSSEAKGSPVLLSVDEAAELLRISSRFVRLLLGRGDLPSVRLGRRVLLRRRDLEKLIENGGFVRAAG